jgi:hypothetical protein
MKVDYILPKPTEDELNLGMKNEYFERILDLNLDKKYKITQNELTAWIHHNYTAHFLLNEEVTLNQLKKIF